MQLLVNIVITFSVLLLLAISFNIIYQTIKFFHLAHAAIITLGPYFTFTLNQQLNIPLIYAIPLAIILIIILIMIINHFIYKPLYTKKSHRFILLIASLGLYVILQNIISLIWGDDTKSIRTEITDVGNEFIGAYVTDIQITTIILCLFLFIATVIFLNKTKLGKQIRAISSNDELSNIFGINSDRTILWALIIGSVLAAATGILVAFDTDMNPTMGFNLLLYGVVAMIIGGVGNTYGLIGGALLLATAQNLGAYYIDGKWMDAIAYFILILFLIWKPLGFSGKKLKKTII